MWEHPQRSAPGLSAPLGNGQEAPCTCAPLPTHPSPSPPRQPLHPRPLDHLPPAPLLARAKAGAHLPLSPHLLSEVGQVGGQVGNQPPSAQSSTHHLLGSQNQGGRGFRRGGCNAETAWRGRRGITLEGRQREVGFFF